MNTIKNILNKLILTKKDREILANAIDNAGPKIFRLLARPDTNMTTIEELATTGITKQVIDDICNGKYYAINVPSIGLCAIQNSTKTETDYMLLFGYYQSHTFIECGELFQVSIYDNTRVKVFIEEL